MGVCLDLAGALAVSVHAVGLYPQSRDSDGQKNRQHNNRGVKAVAVLPPGPSSFSSATALASGPGILSPP